MKKLTKILLLVLTVALLVGALAVSAFAATDDASAVTEGLYWKYTDDSDATQYAADFGTAVSGAKAGSTIYLLADYTITTDAAVATINKEITVDLGGYRFEVSQSSSSAVIEVATKSLVTFKNGAIGACINSNVNSSTQYYGRNYGLLNVTYDNAQVALEDVDTYIGTLVYSYGADNITFTVNGGDHYCIYQGMTWSPSYMCVRAAFTFEANNANFLVTYPGGIISGTTYNNASKTASARHSTATFNNCYIEHTKSNDGQENASFIRQASSATYFYFNGCYIKGAFNPTFSTYDAYTDETDSSESVAAATSANFVFGKGTYWVKSTSNITPSLAEGLAEVTVSKTATATFEAVPSTNGTSFNSAANPSYSGSSYTTANTTRSMTCTAMYTEPTFKYTAGGVETYTDGTLSAAIEAADAGTTVYACKDIELVGASTNTVVLTIAKNITIDLQDHTLVLKQNAQNAISISASATVTFKNGTILCYNVTTPTKAFPIFTPASGSTLNIENIKSYSGGLAYMYSGHNPTVTVTGGEHHLILASNGAWNGLIEMRGYVNFTATDAKFYVANGLYLIVACNYKDTSDKASGHSFTFNNCEIVAESASQNILRNMNGKTELAFNGCYIAASLNPSAYSSDITNGCGDIGNGEVTLGHGTYLASGATVKSGLTTVPEGYVSSEVEESVNITMNYASGTLGTDFATAESDKSFTFTQKIVSENEALENAKFIVTVDGVVNYIDGTFEDAIAVANSASTAATIKLLKDVEIADTDTVTISKALTIDLNGYVLSDVKAPSSKYATIFAKADITILGETAGSKILKTHVVSGAYVGLFIHISQSDITITIKGGEDFVCAAPTIVGAWGQSYNLVIDGGYYTNGNSADNGGIFMANSASSWNINVSNAVFYGTSNMFTSANTSAEHKFVADNCVFMKSVFGTIPTLSSDSVITNSYICGDATFGGGTGPLLLGAGNRVASSATLGTIVKNADGIANLYESSSKTVTTKTVAFSATDGVASYTITEDSATSSFAYVTGASADAEYIVTVSGVDVYVPEGKTFEEILDLVDNGGTVKLLKDITYDSNKKYIFAKKLTLDLNSFTLNVTQTVEKTIGIAMQSQNLFLVKNGSISVTNTVTTSTTYPFFLLEWGNAQLTLQNVNVTAGAFIFNASGDDPKVNIEGGEYNLIYGNSAVIGGLVESRDNITVNVTGAKIYCSGTSLISSLSYNVATNDTYASTFTFTDCDIARSAATNKLFGSINSYTKVYFNNCNVLGSVNFDLHDFDSSKSSAATAANIIIGEGTTIAKNASFDATLADGLVRVYSNESYSWSTSTNTVSSYNIAYKVGSSEGSVFKLTVGGVEVYGGTAITDLATAFTTADASSALYLLTDFQFAANEATDDPFANISKSLTFDLGGHTVYISQGRKDGSTIGISTAEAVNIQNGTFVWNINETYITNYTMDTTKDYSKTSFALFSVKAANANVNLTNINAYGAALIYSYQSSGITLNVNGGEFHVHAATDLLGSSIFEFRANVTINVEGADFYLESGASLINIASYKQASGTTIASTATFTDCDIIAASVTQNALGKMNSYGKVYFNTCRIYGSLNPERPGSDESIAGVPAAGSVVLGNGTYICADATMKADVVVAEDGWALGEADKSYSYSYTAQTGTIYDYENPTIQFSAASGYYTFTLVVGEPPLGNFVITWYQEDGVTIITQTTYVEGTVGVVAPTYTPGDNNGWYKVGFDGWATSHGSNVKADLTAYVVTGDASFYPAQKTDTTPTPYLSGAQYNLSFNNSVILNFYLPNTPVGVTNVVVKDSDGNVIDYDGVYITDANGNKTYYRIYEIAEVNVTELNTTFNITVDFNVDGTYDLQQKVKLSPLGYAKTILADSANETQTYDAATHSMIADMIRYSNQLAVYSDGATVAEYDTLLDTYGSLCTDLPERNGFAAFYTTTKGLEGTVKTVSFEVSSYEPRWVFTFDAATKVTDVSITLNGYFPIPDENGANFGEITYELDSETSIYSGSYLTTAYMVNMPIYNIDQTITINVTVEGGDVISGQYSLNNYYNYMSATGDELENAQEFLKAFRAFAKSSTNYRYASGIIQAGEPAVDKFICDHANAQTFNVASGRYCPDCQAHVFFYSDYITYGTENGYWTGCGAEFSSRDEAMANRGNTSADSYGTIDACHQKANDYLAANPTERVIVKATEGAYYYLYEGDMNGLTSEITIQTDTDWEGAHFISDEESFDITDASFKTLVFGIRGGSVTAPDGTVYTNSGTNITDQLISGVTDGAIVVAKGASKLNFAPGVPMMIELINNNIKRYIRNGANADGGASQHEVILIDEYGNISNTTPVEWDYVYKSGNYCSADCTPVDEADSNTTVDGIQLDGKCDTCGESIVPNFKASAYPITQEHITISGLDDNGNITASFENICNNAVTATSYVGCGRGIQIRRSNVTIEGLEHIFTEDDTSETPRQAYNGFINPYLAYNAVIKDMLVYQHLGHYIKESDNVTDTDNSLGSYEFGGNDSINVTWDNCVVKNFFWDDGTITYRGLFGTNRIRNMYLKNCFLNSFDAHSGAYNVTLENCTFDHINFIGAGDITLNNVTIYTSSSYNMGIHLRQDYGATWNGDLTIKDFTVRYAASSDPAYIDLIRGYYTNWNFGYETYLPHNIYIDGVKTEGYERTSPDTVVNKGEIEENVTETNVVPVAIYSHLDRQLTNNSYDSSTTLDPKHCTTRIDIYNCDAKIAYPRNTFFKDMEVYVEGSKVDWYSAVSSCSTHTDTSTVDGICDNCSAHCGGCSVSAHAGNSSGKCSTCGFTIKVTGSCVTGDTLVTLADGTTARIDSLKDGDMILAWNFETGCVEAVPVAKWVNHGYDNNIVIALTFDDGTTVKVVNAHQFFNVEANDFVTIDSETVASFVGKSFAGINANGEIVTKKLVSYESYVEYNEAYATVSAYHYNIFVEGMLSMDFKERDLGLFRGFEIGADMKFDEEQMAEDIEKYGLYVYEDFADYISEETFELFNFKYMKVAVGKGYSSYEHIVTLIKRYGLK